MPSSSSRIAKNTIFLYFRQILIMLVSLYTVRVVLGVLGEEDYGIYNAVGGVVTLLSFLSGAMASATQRFFSFALGKNDQERLNKTFSTNLIIYTAIAITVVLLLETAGNWFINNQLKVPSERFDAARWIFHLSVLTFVFSVMASPFMAIIISHEDMQIYAYVSIVEAFMKLGVVFALQLVDVDSLKLYAVLLAVVGLVNATIYITICRRKYEECQFKRFYWDRQLFRETIGFTTWTLFGSATTVARNQAVTLLLNQVFNPAIVAANAIATQVAGHTNIFASNFNVGLYPPIIKLYSSGNKDEMFRLIFMGCKMTFFLMWVFALPLWLQMDFVLNLWLKNPPDGAVLFTRLALLEVLINAVSLPIMTAARAPGRMRTYELTLGIIQVMIFVADYVLFKFFDAPAFTVYIVAAIANVLMFATRLIIVKGLVGLPLKKFLVAVIMPVMVIVGVSAVPSIAITKALPQTFWAVCLSITICIAISSALFLFVALKKYEREAVLEKVRGRLQRKKP